MKKFLSAVMVLGTLLPGASVFAAESTTMPNSCSEIVSNYVNRAADFNTRQTENAAKIAASEAKIKELITAAQAQGKDTSALSSALATLEKYAAQLATDSTYYHDAILALGKIDCSTETTADFKGVRINLRTLFAKVKSDADAIKALRGTITNAVAAITK